MAKRKLTELQYAAVAKLALPKRGGLSYAEVAEEVGVSTQSLWNWRQMDVFQEELKKQVLRNAVEHLPDMYASIPNHVIEDGNAAMFRTYLQSLGMLTEKVEVESKGDATEDLDAMRAEVEAYRQGSSEG